ncbi:MAG TPA: DUF1667 domain-containing protein, partial [Bacillota bacterium]|nr:DUF1667 domain-containing protein [Bacillota bacterium]
TVTVSPGEAGLTVSGHECRRGEEYALQEYTDPRRVLTGTVAVDGAALPRLPVKTDGPIPKTLVREAAAALSRIKVRASVRCGEIIVANFAGSGSNLVATRDLGPDLDL